MVSVEAHESIASLRPEWDQLVSRMATAPSLHPGWFAAWWPAFGRGRLTVLAARVDGELEGVAPLARKAGGLASPTNWHTPLYGAVCASPEAVEALADALVRRAGAHIRLRFLDSADILLEPLAAAAERAGWTAVSRPMQRSPYVSINGSWEEYRAGLSQKLRRNLTRRERRLAELGEVSVRIEDGSERLDALLSAGFALEASGWKGERGTAILSTPETRSFYTEMCHWAASRDMLRLGFVRLDGNPIAFNLCLEHAGVQYVLKPGYREDMARYGPGMLLTYRMLERAFARGLKSYEFLGKQDDFKRSFAGENCRVRLETQAFAGSPRGVATRMIQTHGRSMARRLLARRG